MTMTVEERLAILHLRYEKARMPLSWIPCMSSLDDEYGVTMLWTRMFQDGDVDGRISPAAMRLAAYAPALLAVLMDLSQETGRFSESELENIYTLVSYLVPEAGVVWASRSPPEPSEKRSRK